MQKLQQQTKTPDSDFASTRFPMQRNYTTQYLEKDVFVGLMNPILNKLRFAGAGGGDGAGGASRRGSLSRQDSPNGKMARRATLDIAMVTQLNRIANKARKNLSGAGEGMLGSADGGAGAGAAGAGAGGISPVASVGTMRKNSIVGTGSQNVSPKNVGANVKSATPDGTMGVLGSQSLSPKTPRASLPPQAGAASNPKRRASVDIGSLSPGGLGPGGSTRQRPSMSLGTGMMMVGSLMKGANRARESVAQGKTGLSVSMDDESDMELFDADPVQEEPSSDENV